MHRLVPALGTLAVGVTLLLAPSALALGDGTPATVLTLALTTLGWAMVVVALFVPLGGFLDVSASTAVTVALVAVLLDALVRVAVADVGRDVPAVTVAALTPYAGGLALRGAVVGAFVAGLSFERGERPRLVLGTALLACGALSWLLLVGPGTPVLADWGVGGALLVAGVALALPAVLGVLVRRAAVVAAGGRHRFGV